MISVKGPYFIEEFSYKRDAKDREQGVLLMTAAGGEQFGAPMSITKMGCWWRSCSENASWRMKERR